MTTDALQRRMSQIVIPGPKINCSAKLEKLSGRDLFHGGCAAIWDDDQNRSVNALGLPYTRIKGGAYPPFFSRQAVEDLQDKWTARSDDVFLVFPSDPVCNAFQSFSVALVEQCDVDSIDPQFPRWLDAAVSCRGWEYVDAIDKTTARRCLTTKVPPWRFPSSSFNFRCGGSVVTENESDLPLIAVFVSDPRIMIMKELFTAMKYAECAQVMGCRPQNKPNIDLNDLLMALVQNDCADSSGMGLIGNSLRTTFGWAKVEQMHPDRIRLFFTEDFMLQPEVAMRGLATFLQVPELSAATENAIREAARLAHCVAPIEHFNSLTAAQSHKDSMVQQHLSIEGLVLEFEQQLSLAPQAVQLGWVKLMEGWLVSPNSVMVTYAQTVLKHQKWSPPHWWSSHNARLCRPCLFFPRGTCNNDVCPYCHGPNHAKPKRPAKSKRASRRRFDRTPSPDTPHYTAITAQVSFLQGRPSAQTRYDRTPSPERMYQWIAGQRAY